jgi:hypothetical protein
MPGLTEWFENHYKSQRPGTYTISASLSGFKKVQRTGVVLRAASVVRTDLNLEVGGLADLDD